MLKFTIIDRDLTETVLQSEPVGFDGVKMRLMRHPIYHGFFTFIDDAEFSMQFVEDGYSILKNEFDTFGLESKMSFRVDFACSDTDTFEELFIGQFDFATYKENCGSKCYVEVGVMETKCTVDFLKRFDQKVNLDSLVPFDADCDEVNTTGTYDVVVTFPNKIKVLKPHNINGLKVGDTFTISASGTGGIDGTYTITVINDTGFTNDLYIEVAEVFPADDFFFVTIESDCLRKAELEQYYGLGKDIKLKNRPLVYRDAWQMKPDTEIVWTDDGSQVVGQASQVWLSLDWNKPKLTEIISSNNLQTSYLQRPQGSNAVMFSDSYIEIVNLQRESGLNCSYNFDIHFKADGSWSELSNETRVYGVVFKLRWGDTYGHFPIFEIAHSETIYNLFSTASTTGGVTNSGTFSIDYTKTLSLNFPSLMIDRVLEQKIFLNLEIFELQYTTGSVGSVDPCVFTFHFDSASLNVQLVSDCEDTTTKGYMINEVFSRISEIYTNSCLPAFSTFYGRKDSLPYTNQDPTIVEPAPDYGCGALTILTNGLKIRNAKMQDETEPPLSLSMKDVFEAMRAVHNIGIGIEYDNFKDDGSSLLRVEQYLHFYRDEIVLVCDNPTNVRREVNFKDYFSKVNAGYSKWETENTNGLMDIQGRREYRTTLSTVTNEYTALCQFIASDFAIETTRRKFGGVTNDWRYDNDTFIICIDKTNEEEGDLAEYENETFDFPPNTSANVMFPEKYYNLRISPIRNILRHLSVILRSYKGLVNKKVLFTTGEGNYLAKFDLSDNDCFDENKQLEENRNLDASDFKVELGNIPIYSNEIITFDYPLSYDNWKLLRLNPYGLIQYSCNGVTGFGWIEDVRYSPTNKGIATFKLKEKI